MVQWHLRRRLVLVAVVHVGGRDDAAEVAPAGGVLDQQRDVAAVLERHLGAVDGAEAEAGGGHGELHRAAQAVVVGQRERVIAELDRRERQLVGQRRPVEEGEGRVGVELDVHEHMFAYAEAAALVLARRRPEVDAGVDRVLVDLRELVAA